MTKCEHWDAGWCYAPVDVKTNAIGKFGVCKLPEYCPYLKSQNKMNEIQQTKEDIAVLQEKLKKLEELEIQKSKTPVEEAYKKVYGWYPPTTSSPYDLDGIWIPFQKGYNASKDECSEWKNAALLFGEELVSIIPCGYYDMTAEEWVKWAKGAYEKNSDDLLKLVREKQRKCEALVDKLQEKNWNVDVKTNLKPHWEPTPQTPEQVEQGLRDAMKQAKEDGVFDEPKPETLYEALTNLGYYEDYCDQIVDAVRCWLPKEQSAKGSQNVYVECTVDGFNDCLKKIKSKLK